MLVLGIESTCDETACAIVRNGDEILSSVVSSQIDLHKEFGGVVPELACRRHIDVMIPVIDQAVKNAGIHLNDVNLIAVARGPGLVGPLLIGVNAAKSLALVLNKPLISVNHIEAHLYACMMNKGVQISYPCLGVVISGGHTAISLINGLGEYKLIGQTVDDAIGEAFDKVAKLMGLPYPGGPRIEELAKQGNSQAYPFKPCKVKGRPFEFSFSGLKTSVLYTLKGQDGSGVVENLSEKVQSDIAASFQRAALEDVIGKILAASKKYGCRDVILGGGVTNNMTLRKMLAEAAPELNFVWPPKGLSLDNAAMNAGLGFHRYKLQGHGDPLDLDVLTQMPL